MEELKKNYSDFQNIYLQGITLREFYKKYFFPWYKLDTVEKTYVKTDKALKCVLAHVSKNADGKNQTNSYSRILTCLLSNNYIKQIFNKLRIIFKLVVILEEIEENPINAIGKIRTERSVVEFWTVDELKKLYNCPYLCDFEENFYKRMIRFLFVTGLRSFCSQMVGY